MKSALFLFLTILSISSAFNIAFYKSPDCSGEGLAFDVDKCFQYGAPVNNTYMYTCQTDGVARTNFTNPYCKDSNNTFFVLNNTAITNGCFKESDTSSIKSDCPGVPSSQQIIHPLFFMLMALVGIIVL
eukprot:TRINITY_DN11716_c0_g1_i1.p2 TRINITY_DN11716_c0_g1~~TRINITY_DN11716_c0_g1_i1.p2  ORF type:complete len:139 (+),score=32.51 TRINITY_DN11716_c0_g1_i1:31-417(+)